MSIRTLSKELQEKAKTELNEEPSRIENDIHHIRDWLKKQPHLNARTDDQWLLGFLRHSKFSIQKTKAKLDFFYTVKTLTPEFFANKDPLLPELQDILNRGIAISLLKHAEPAGTVIVLLQFHTSDVQKNSILNIFKVALMMGAIMLIENDNFSISGEEIVFNLRDFPFFKEITPAFCKKFALVLQSALPVRLKRIHIINAPVFFETIFALFKPLLSEKIKNRIKLYGKDDLSNLYKDVPLSVLPKEYGGEGGCIDEIAAEWKKKLESYREWFLEDDQYISDESKRQGEPITSADVFGVEDVQWLLGFLRHSKFSIQKTKAKLDFYYTVKTLTPEFFANKDPLLPELQDILNRRIAISLLKHAKPAGTVIFLLQFHTADVQKNSILNITKLALMMGDIMLIENDNFSVSGIEIVFNLRDFPFFREITPAFCKKFLLVLQSAFPVRLKRVHIINAPVFFETLFAFFKPYLSEKIKNRIKLYGKNDLSQLYNEVALSVLPKEYGGEGGCIDEIAAEWKKKLESYREWFLEDDQYISDESKRSGKPITSADVFGVEGSFRKLIID